MTQAQPWLVWSPGLPPDKAEDAPLRVVPSPPLFAASAPWSSGRTDTLIGVGCVLKTGT
jgi:hypothetical protein